MNLPGGSYYEGSPDTIGWNRLIMTTVHPAIMFADHTGERTESASGDNGGLERPRNGLWIERMARRLGAETAADRLFGRPDLAPYLIVGTVILVDFGLLTALQSLLPSSTAPYLLNPASVLIPAGTMFALWGSRRLRDDYETAIEGLLERDGTEQLPQSPGRLWNAVLRADSTRVTDTNARAVVRQLVSDRLKAALLLLGWGYHGSWILLNPDAQTFIFDVNGPVIGSIKFFVIIPLVYYVVAVDFGSIYLGVLLLAPVKLRATGFIDLQDPLGYGRLKPFGDLTKSATLYYFVAISAYILLIGISDILARAGAPLPRNEIVNLFGVGLAITFGVVLFVLPILIIHGLMKHAKHEKIHQLAREVEACGPSDDEMMFPDTKVPDSVEEGHDYIQYFIKITKVENTHEYPVDVSHIQEIALAALVPYMAHVTVTFLVSYTATSGGH